MRSIHITEAEKKKYHTCSKSINLKLAQNYKNDQNLQQRFENNKVIFYRNKRNLDNLIHEIIQEDVAIPLYIFEPRISSPYLYPLSKSPSPKYLLSQPPSQSAASSFVDFLQNVSPSYLAQKQRELRRKIELVKGKSVKKIQDEVSLIDTLLNAVSDLTKENIELK